MTAARLMLAAGTGSGRLVRRPSVILFDPADGNQDLAARFSEAASDTEALDAVKKHLIDSGFTAAPLVAASWDLQQLNLLIFGDVAIQSSAVAAPMVSGAGSASWVERHVGEIERGSEPTLELWSGDAADPSTNLELGVVACAGFRLSLVFAAAAGSASPASPSESAHPAAKAQPVVAPPEPPQFLEPLEPPEPPEPPAIADQAAMPEPVGVGEPWTEPPAEPPARAEFVAEPVAAPEPPAESVVSDEAAFEPAPPDVVVNEDDSTIGDTTGAGPQDPFTNQPSEPPGRTGLIEAAHCQQGHPNPPRAATCYRCGISLLDDQSLSLIDQPAVGRIVFPGGQSVLLDRDMELGRKPTPTEGIHPVIIDHAEVSRTHASLTVQGWTALVTDKGSRNGTWVVPPNDVTPVRLDEGVAHVMEHGSRVQLGGPEVVFTYLFDAEES